MADSLLCKNYDGKWFSLAWCLGNGFSQASMVRASMNEWDGVGGNDLDATWNFDATNFTVFLSQAVSFSPMRSAPGLSWES